MASLPPFLPRRPDQQQEVPALPLTVHRQFPMFKSFGPQRPAQKSVLEYPEASFGLAAPPLQLHKTFFFHSLSEPRRGLRANPVVNVLARQQRLVGRAAESPVGAPASTSSTANISVPAPKVRLKCGPQAFPAAIIIQLGRRMPSPCSKNSSLPNRPLPTAPAPANSTVIRCLRPDGDIFYLRHAPNPKAKPFVLLHCPVF